jgi:hypothetical protein
MVSEIFLRAPPCIIFKLPIQAIASTIAVAINHSYKHISAMHILHIEDVVCVGCWCVITHLARAAGWWAAQPQLRSRTIVQGYSA